MATVIATLLTLLPLLIPLFQRLAPKILPKLAGLFGAGTLVAGGSMVAKGGAIAGIVAILSKIWGFLGRFPKFLVGLFAFGGKLYWFRGVLEFLLLVFKSPVVLLIGLVTSSIFPGILEKIFLVVGAAVMHIFVFLFGIAKKLFMKMSASEGGSPALDEFREAVYNSFSSLPPCMVKTMGYVHFVEDLGLITTCMMLILTVSIFRVMFGAYGVGKVTGNGAFL